MVEEAPDITYSGDIDEVSVWCYLGTHYKHSRGGGGGYSTGGSNIRHTLMLHSHHTSPIFSQSEHGEASSSQRRLCHTIPPPLNNYEWVLW